MNIEVSDSDMFKVEVAMTGIKNGAKRVLTQAINKTVKTMATQTRVRIGNELNLKAARISKDLSTRKATFGSLSGAVVAKGKPVGLVSFGATQNKKGVRVKVKRSGGTKLLKHAFIAKGLRGQNPGDGTNNHAFWREYKGTRKALNPNINYWALPNNYRLPVKTLYGPRIEDIFASDKVLKPIETQAAYIFPLNIDKGIADILRRFG